MLTRIIYKPDGTVANFHPIECCRLKDESDKAFIERIWQKDMVEKNSPLVGLPYDDIEMSELPIDENGKKIDGGKWRGEKGKGVKIDKTVVTEREKKQAIEEELDAELEKSEPDLIKVMKLKRKLDKKDFS